MSEPLHEALHEAYDVDVAKLNRLAARSAERAEKLKAENARLRELADAVKEFVEDTHCEDCPCRRDCDDNNRIFCANDFSYHAFAAMRELGVGNEHDKD